MSSTITGMMKFFYQNKLRTEAFTVTVSTGDGTKAYIYDLDRETAWYSSGSNDTITETIEIDFSFNQTIDRLVLLNMNFKEFGIQYYDGSWKDFTNVYSLSTDSAASSISYTDNSLANRYFEFDSVVCTKIKISCLKTISANQEKYLHEFYVGQEIGTFIEDVTGNPNSYSAIAENYNAVFIKKSNFGMIKINTSNKFSAEFNLSEFLESNDQEILQTLLSVGQFAIYPCGGANTYTTQKGWRLSDFYSVISDGDLSASFSIGRNSNLGLNQSFNIMEQ